MSCLTRDRGRLRRQQHGQAAVEFALTVVFLMVLLVSMLELTMFVYTYSVLADAAKEGVRYAIVHGASGTDSSGPSSGTASSSPWPSCSTPASGSLLSTVQTYAAASLHNTADMNIYACYPDGNNKPGSAVQVSVSYPYEPLFGLSWPRVNVNANSAGRIMF
jgi:Flp pilus assembly protein TadG